MTTTPIPDFEELARLLERATPRPWTAEPLPPYEDGPAAGFARSVVVAATAASKSNRVYADPPGGSFPAADRDLIVASVNALPFLLSERETLAREKAAADGRNDACRTIIATLEREKAELVEKVRVLSEALTESRDMLDALGTQLWIWERKPVVDIKGAMDRAARALSNG